MKSFFEMIKNNNTEGLRNLIPQYKEYSELTLDVRKGELLRYSGIPAAELRHDGLGKMDDSYLERADSDGELSAVIDDVINKASGVFSYRVAFVTCLISHDEEGYPILPFSQHSDDLAKNLEGCTGAVIFAATVGSGIDMLIRRYERTDRVRGLLLQGLGAERAEALCDTFNREIAGMAAEFGFDTRPRYSPGYGDLPISVQPGLLNAVNAEKRLGITLNSSFLMSPSKSVTAVVGIKCI